MTLWQRLTGWLLASLYASTAPPVLTTVDADDPVQLDQVPGFDADQPPPTWDPTEHEDELLSDPDVTITDLEEVS